MGNIYVTCARCNKGMTIAEYNCVFCSDIDNQFVCADCYKKEQPKELMKKITDLETKLAESENFYKDLGFKDEKDARDYLIDCITQPKDLVEDVKKLKQQLKEKDQAIESLQEINQSLGQTCNNDAKEIERLREQLEEKEREETKRMQDFEKGCQEYYKSNQTAMAELEKVRTCFGDYLKGLLWNDTMLVGKVCNMINEIVDQQIKSLKGEK